MVVYYLVDEFIGVAIKLASHEEAFEWKSLHAG